MSAERTITLDEDGTLRVSSEYNDEIRLLIKSLPGTRWDGRDRTWCVPAQHRAALLQRLQRFDFSLDPALVAPGDAGAQPGQPDTYTIRQVNQAIRAALHRGFPESIWVRGEVSNFDKGAARPVWFFDLVEKTPGGDEVAARLQVVVYSDERSRIQWRLRQAAEPLSLQDGLEVRLLGHLDYFSRGGRLQLVVEDVDPDFAFGQLARRRTEILEALSREGLLDRNRRLPWPALPLRVGLLTASDSDAYHDFAHTLQRAPYAFEVVHYPVAVQGPRLEAEMLAALDYFALRPGRVDVLVIARGGGSRADLAWLDNLSVARRVAGFPLKVLVGAGHERDRSVLDEIAESEKTPTAAAERLIERVARADEALDRLARRMAARTRERLSLARQRHHLQRSRLLNAAHGQVRRAQLRIERDLAWGVRQAVRARLAVERARLRGVRSRLRPSAVRRRLTELTARLDERQRRLGAAAPPHLREDARQLAALSHRLRAGSLAALRRQAQHLAVLAARADALDPRKTLARGYAIVRDAHGHLVRTPADAPVGSAIQVTLPAGALDAQVTAHASAPEETE